MHCLLHKVMMLEFMYTHTEVFEHLGNTGQELVVLDTQVVMDKEAPALLFRIHGVVEAVVNNIFNKVTATM